MTLQLQHRKLSVEQVTISKNKIKIGGTSFRGLQYIQLAESLFPNYIGFTQLQNKCKCKLKAVSRKQTEVSKCYRTPKNQPIRHVDQKKHKKIKHKLCKPNLT